MQQPVPNVLVGQPSLHLLKIGYFSLKPCSYDSLNKAFGKVDSIVYSSTSLHTLQSALACTPRQQVIVFAHLIQLDVKILLVSMTMM